MLIIAILAMTLRPTLTSAGPVLDDIRLATGLGLQGASLLTVLPMFCMGVFPLLLPWLGRYLSENAWIAGGLFAIALAGVWRLWLGSGWELIISALVGGTGIAIVQAMAPGIVKRWYPQRVPVAMGVYSASLMAGGGMAAILTPLVAKHYNSWQAGLGMWFIIPVIAMLLWWLRPRERMEAKHSSVKRNFFINQRAWLLAAYFGLANGGYACMIAWLPSYAQNLGWSAQHSGELIGVMTVFQVIGALGAPLLSSTRTDRRPWLLAAVVFQLVGFIGLIVLPAPMMNVWVGLIGCGLGACFSLTLTVALDHLVNPKLAGVLTAFVQGVGFIITAIIPYVAGVLLDLTHSYQASWLMLVITLIAMLIMTTKFSPASYVKAMSD
jgi:CP family cyanate transporter-like MFS transporter